MRSFAWIFAFVFAIHLPFESSARDLSVSERARVDAVLDGLVEEGDPGFAIGVVREGEIVLEHYEGLADLSFEVEIGQATRFNIASNAKQFVGVMALSLAEQGQIDLPRARAGSPSVWGN